MSKNYTALYRKYRPATFGALVGQDHIVRILKNQIEGGSVGHAYLFTGSRGTGKTSAAKIFARAVNCERPVEGSPCYKCETCRAMDDPSNLDVTEIDAASNNRVDEIRDLREKVKYPPLHGKYKVYIVDEVHMLSDSAFNALLKTLEEPPAHALFILATTEAHKLPATILSRVMRFDFRLLSVDALAGILRGIFKDIGKEFDEDAVNALAAAGEGSVRDALSIADMCVSFSRGKLTLNDVLEVLGAADAASIFELGGAILSGGGANALNVVNRLINAGKSPAQLGKDLALFFRNLLVVKTCGGRVKDILYLPDEITARYVRAADGAGCDKLYECAESFARLDAELRYSITPRVMIEILCLKLARNDGSFSEKPETAEKPAAQKEPAPQNAPKDTPQRETGDVNARKIWGTVVKGLRDRGEYSLHAITSDKFSVYIRGKHLVLRVHDAAEYESFSEPVNLAAINGILEDTGYTFLPEMAGGRGGGGDVIGDSIKKLYEFAGDDKVKVTRNKKQS